MESISLWVRNSEGAKEKLWSKLLDTKSKRIVDSIRAMIRMKRTSARGVPAEEPFSYTEIEGRPSMTKADVLVTFSISTRMSAGRASKSMAESESMESIMDRN